MKTVFTHFFFRNSLRTLGAMMLLALATEVSAQATYTSNASGNWNDTGSWTIGGTPDGDTDGIPDANDDVIITSAHVITVDALSNALSVTINAGATLDLNGFTFISAVPLTLDGGSLINGSVTGVTYSGAITLAGAGSIIANSGTIDVTGNIDTGGFVLTLDGTADGEVSGVISNTGAVTKTGTGTWTLSGANTFSGATTLSDGTLNIGHATAIGSGTLVINGGTIDNTSGGTITLSNNNPQTWNADFTFTGTNALNLGTGVVTMGASRQVTVSANALTVGGALSAPGADLTKAGNGTLSFDDNAVTLDGLTINGGTLIAPTSSGSLTLASDLTNNDTFDHNDGTVTFNGVTQTIGGSAATTLNNVVTTGATNTSTGVSTTIAGNLSVGAGTTFTAAGFNLTVTGTTSIAGTLAISSAVGVKTFTGLVTIDAGASWNNSANADVTFGGGITNNNVFNAGSGVNTFNNTRFLTGSFSIPRVVVSGILANTNTLTVSTSLSGSGTLIQEPNAILNIGGTTSLTALDATASDNTVNYTGASQPIFATPYQNLGINQLSGQALLDGDLAVNDQLTMTSGHLNLGGYVLTLGPSAVITGAGASRFIIASGSEVRKEFTAGGAFTFPIGDNTGMIEYSPVAVTVTGTAFGANAYIAASVVDAKHSSNASAANFLTRYWAIEQSAITNCQVDVTGTYLNADISGIEANLGAATLEGAFNQTTNPWVKTGFVVDAANNELEYTGVALTAGLTSVFTGIRGASPTVSIDQGATAQLCPGGSIALTTTVTGGDPTIIYSWTPAAGLSATTVSNPTVTPSVNNTYTVTIRDGNGITATDNINVTINPAPAITSHPVSVTQCADNGTTFTVAATGTTLTYQWRRNGVNLTNAGVYSGVNTSTLTISSVAGVGGNFDVVVTETSATPNCPVTSNAATLTVNPLPTGLAVTTAASAVCYGTSTNIQIAGSQSGVTYQLRNDAGDIAIGSPVAGTGGLINLPTGNLTANTTFNVFATITATG
ncbi:autotransporter-associated beta strand repeat-containing protein, partial [Fulvivirgaceae bacterium PWU4]